MFIHYFAGCIVFLVYGTLTGYAVDSAYLALGAVCGAVADPVSYLLSWTAKVNKWAHKHRDNISHTVFPPLIILAVGFSAQDHTMIAAGLAMMTHPLLDLYGIGWGVKLFYPLSNKSYKVGHDGRLLTIWSQDEVDTVAEDTGDSTWIKNIYCTPNVIGAIEWGSLLGTVALIALY